MAKITLNGNPVHTNGELPAVGAKAPDFKLTGGDLKDVSLADYKGKRKILNIVPSLDTTSARPPRAGSTRPPGSSPAGTRAATSRSSSVTGPS